MSDNQTHELASESSPNASPRPTYAPAATALGIMLLFWGVVTMWIMSVVGAGLIAWSLWMWINEIRRE